MTTVADPALLPPMINALVAAILTMQGTIAHTPTCRHTRRAEAVAPLLEAAAERHALDPLVLAAVMVRESSARMHVVGARGEKGYMQIKPDGMAKLKCPDLNLDDPKENVECGARLLVMARERCGGDVRNWIGTYNGRRCGPSAYADRVLVLVDRVRGGTLAAAEGDVIR